MKQTYPFTLEPLPYPHDALEPHIDARTVQIHHQKHLQAYVDHLNRALEKYPQYHEMTLKQMLCRLNLFPSKIRNEIKNNAGGVYNHNMYFRCMQPASGQSPLPRVQSAMLRTFGSYEVFFEEMESAALRQFGSGYAWLCLSRGRQLRIMTTSNQDNPLSFGLTPILNIDVWEHAYYLKYQNLRGDYVKNWFTLINWETVEDNFCGNV